MKQGRIWLLWVGVCWVGMVQGQKNDYNWMAGYDSEVGYSNNFHYWFGMSVFNFNQQPVSIQYDSVSMNFHGANSTVSDINGNLKFYTNGITVRNYLDEVIGDSLHNGFFLNYLPLWYYEGNPLDIAMIVLPNPLHEGRYDILYCYVDTIENFDTRFKKMLRTQIDMNGNFGKGAMVYKDQPFYLNATSNCLTAVKHANGRDWWLLSMKEGTNCYNVMLYDGNSNIQIYPEQCGGFIFQRTETASLRFSADGSRLVSMNHGPGKVDFFEFNRCTGGLNLIEEVSLPERFDSSGYLFFGVEISPNGRFAYVCGNKRLYQFDMQATPIASSKTTVGVSIGNSTYNHPQLAPDGKIYISSRNTTYYMSVINNPDLPGVACNSQDTVRLPSFIAGLPYYPNYRLGALPGSPCDTISSINETERATQLKVFPNPATENVTIDYGFTDWSKGEVSLEITNALGQVVYKQDLPMYSGFQKLNVGSFASGLYQVYIKRRGVVVAAEKMVKE